MSLLPAAEFVVVKVEPNRLNSLNHKFFILFFIILKQQIFVKVTSFKFG